MQEDNTKGQPPSPQAQWSYTPDTPANPLPASQDLSVEWTASEYVTHQKGAGWYILLLLVTVLIAAGVYYLTNGDVVSTVAMVGVALAFGIFAARPARTLQYMIDNRGIKVGDKLYGYDMLKSFSVMQEGAIRYIWFMPMKRFMLPVTLYYDPEDEEKIAEVLSSFLPYEERDHDIIDRLMHKIRF